MNMFAVTPFRRVSFRHPLLGQPEGDVVDISHTSELRPGDIIYVEFPAFAAGRFLYGDSEAFTVLSVDPASNTVAVRDESGKETSFQGGTREAMLSKIEERTRVARLLVVRPGAARVAPTREQALVAKAIELGLPERYEPVSVTSMSDAELEDFILTAPAGGYARLFALVGFDEATGTLLTGLVGSEDPSDRIGEIWTLWSRGSPVESHQVVFRETDAVWNFIIPIAIAAGAVGVVVALTAL